MIKAFMHRLRGDINTQNTGLLAPQRVLGYTYAPANGGAGIPYQRTANSINPATVMVGPSHKVNDPTVTGNVSGTLDLNALSDPMDAIMANITGNI